MRKHLRIIISSLILFVFVLSLYTATLPNINTGYADSDEFITAAKVFGVVHPPGYPLYTMLCILFAHLPLPFTFAGKVNFLSAVLHAVSVALIFGSIFLLLKQFIKEEWKRILFASIGAVTLSISYAFWFYSLFAEVFALNDFFTAVVLFLVSLWWSRGHPGEATTSIGSGRKHLKQKDSIVLSRALQNDNIFHSKKLLLIVAFAVGLGLSNQQVFILLVPACIFLITGFNWKLIRDWRFLLLCFGAVFLGFLVPYIYLPLAALRNPIINWEDPDTLNGFLRSITRKTFAEWSSTGDAYGAAQVSLDVRINGFLRYVHFLRESLTWPILVLSLVGGMYLLLIRQFRILIFLVLGILGGGMFFSLYAPNTITTEYIYYYATSGIYERFFKGSLFFVAILTGFGSFGMYMIVKKYLGKISLITIGIVFCYLVFIGQAHFKDIKKNDFTIGNTYGRIFLESLPKNSVVFCFSEHTCFTGLYLQEIEGVRRDVKIIHAALTVYPLEEIKKHDPTLVKTTAIKSTAQHTVLVVRDMIRWNIDKRPMYVAGIQSNNELLSAYGLKNDPFYLIPEGCAYRIAREYKQVPEKERDGFCHGLDELETHIHESYLTKKAPISHMFSNYMASIRFGQAARYAAYECYTDAKRELEKSLKLAPYSTIVQNTLNGFNKKPLDDKNCGMHTSAKNKDELLKLADESLEKNDVMRALHYTLQAVTVAPHDIPARLKLAELYEMSDAMNNAKIEYEDILELEPNNIAKKKLERVEKLIEIDQ